METGVSDDEGTYEIPLLTNHTISIRKSTDQTLPATDAQQAASTRTNAIEGVDWLTYDLNQEITVTIIMTTNPNSAMSTSTSSLTLPARATPPQR